MEDCLQDLLKLGEILDPVHRYNLGDRAAFIALKRKIESRVVEEAPGKMGRMWKLRMQETQRLLSGKSGGKSGSKLSISVETRGSSNAGSSR